MIDDARAREKKGFEELVAATEWRGVAHAVLFADGPAGQVLSEAARTSHAELIVVGTHGRTGLDRFLLGSTAESIIRTSEINVLIVPAR